MAKLARKPSSDVLDSLTEHLASVGAGKPSVLAWGETPDGVLVALRDRLAIRDGQEWTTFLWHEINHATWTDDGEKVTWTLVASPFEEHAHDVTEPGRVPEAMTERINATIMASQVIELLPGRRATLVGRRSLEPGDDGSIRWVIIPAKGVDLSRPELADAAAEWIERAQEYNA